MIKTTCGGALWVSEASAIRSIHKYRRLSLLQLDVVLTVFVFYNQLVVMNIIVDAVNSSLMNPDDCSDSKTASVRR